MQCGFDIVLLPTLGPAAQKDHQYLAVPAEIHTIARAPIDLQFGRPLADRFHVRGVAFGEAPDRGRDTRRGVWIKFVKPTPERAFAVLSNFLIIAIAVCAIINMIALGRAIRLKARKERRRHALESIASRNWTLLPDYKFDREDANER